MYECLFSQFRHEAKSTDEDPQTTYGTVDFIPHLIDPKCEAISIEYTITLEEVNQYKDVLDQLPEWLQKNIVTTIDTSDCSGSDRRRAKRHLMYKPQLVTPKPPLEVPQKTGQDSSKHSSEEQKERSEQHKKQFKSAVNSVNNDGKENFGRKLSSSSEAMSLENKTFDRSLSQSTRFQKELTEDEKPSTAALGIPTIGSTSKNKNSGAGIFSDPSSYSKFHNTMKKSSSKINGTESGIETRSSQGDKDRKKRDSFDDVEICEGECGFLWECANFPATCSSTVAVFDNCFDPNTQFIYAEPCLTVYSCINGPVILPNQCTYFVECMRLDTIREPECFEVVDCFHHVNRSVGRCNDVFQCLEDQIEHKCEDPPASSEVPVALSPSELTSVCGQIDDIYAEEPSLANQENSPLSIVVFKGPTEYATRDFVFASVRLSASENGAWVAIHPSFEEISERVKTQDRLSFLLYAINDIRWTFAARFFKSFHFMSRYENKLEDVLQESEIRGETVLSRLNSSSPFLRDFQPIEILLQWKDGFIISSNRFIGVTIWDAFAVVANTLLMLERAWLTWGRLSKKLVNTKAQMYLDKYEVGITGMEVD
ncbi:uncharacterized protein LOC142336057 isoform X2 [Convolutriloba macropyga]